jgi:hypothetical protein
LYYYVRFFVSTNLRRKSSVYDRSGNLMVLEAEHENLGGVDVLLAALTTQAEIGRAHLPNPTGRNQHRNCREFSLIINYYLNETLIPYNSKRHS